MVGPPLLFHPRVSRDTKMKAIAEQHRSLLERKMMSIFMDDTDHVEAKDSKDAIGNANGNGCRDFPVLHREWLSIMHAPATTTCLETKYVYRPRCKALKALLCV